MQPDFANTRTDYNPYQGQPQITDTNRLEDYINLNRSSNNPFWNQAKTRIPQQVQPQVRKDYYTDYPRTGEFIKDPNPLEDLLNQLFNFQEKWDFLKSLGYKPLNEEINNSDISLTTVVIREGGHGTIENIFIKEMSIKLKNLLLSKSVLKLKL